MSSTNYVNEQITDSVSTASATQPTEVNGAVVDAVHEAVQKAVTDSATKNSNARLLLPLYVLTAINTVCILYLISVM